MEFCVSPDLGKDLRKIIIHNKKLARQIEKQLLLFQQNHLHPSLRIHKLTGNQKIFGASPLTRISECYFS